eukprot:363265-Chlamydomonas_euryale.AAC.8
MSGVDRSYQQRDGGRGARHIWWRAAVVFTGRIAARMGLHHGPAASQVGGCGGSCTCGGMRG